MEKKIFSNEIKDEKCTLSKTDKKKGGIKEGTLKNFYFCDELEKKESLDFLKEDLESHQVTYEPVSKKYSQKLREDLTSYLANWS